MEGAGVRGPGQGRRKVIVWFQVYSFGFTFFAFQFLFLDQKYGTQVIAYDPLFEGA